MTRDDDTLPGKLRVCARKHLRADENLTAIKKMQEHIAQLQPGVEAAPYRRS